MAGSQAQAMAMLWGKTSESGKTTPVAVKFTPVVGDNPAVTIPMVFCGELVGGMGVLSSSSEISPEHRAILQLVAYQLAASLRNAQALEAAESDSMVDELTVTDKIRERLGPARGGHFLRRT